MLTNLLLIAAGGSLAIAWKALAAFVGHDKPAQRGRQLDLRVLDHVAPPAIAAEAEAIAAARPPTDPATVLADHVLGCQPTDWFAGIATPTLRCGIHQYVRFDATCPVHTALEQVEAAR